MKRRRFLAPSERFMGSWKQFLSVMLPVLFGICGVQASIIDSTWVGGENGTWEQASNWNPSIVPNNTSTNSFNVTIGEENSYVEIGLEQGRTVNQIICYGEVELSKWTIDWILLTLTGTNGITNYGSLEVEGMAIQGNIINHGGLDLDDLEIEGNVTNKSGAYFFGVDVELENGDIVNEAGAKIESDGDGAIWVEDGSVYNRGDMLLAPGGAIWVRNEFQNDGTIALYDGACSGDTLFLNDSNGVIEGYGMIHAEDAIINKGLIRSVGGGLNLLGRSTYGSTYEGWPAQGSVANTGTLTNSCGTTLTVMMDVPDFVNAGTLLVRSNGAIVFDNSNLRNEASGTILLRGGSLEANCITNAQGAQFNGLGSISADLAVESNSRVHFTGPSVIYGDVTISAGATLQISDGQTLITGQTTNNGTIHLLGGTVVFQGGYTGEGQIINEAGADRNHFDVNADGIENIKDLAVFAENWLWKASWY